MTADFYCIGKTVLFSLTKIQTVAVKLGKELESHVKWLLNNKLPLHLWKINLYLIGLEHKLKNNKYFNIKCNAHVIKS